jgi:hypothetical protein
MILLGLLAWICFSALFKILGRAGSLQICTPLIGYDLCPFVLDSLDLWLRCPASRILAAPLGLIPWCLADLRTSCNLSSGEWKPSCHLGTRSGCGKVREACPPPMGQNIVAFLICDCFCLGTLYSHLLPRLPFRILWLLGCALRGHPCCETCTFGYVACLIRRLLVNAPFCYYKRILHLRICLLFPLVLTLFWALFSLILPRDPNSEGQPKSVCCSLIGDVFGGVFY